MIRRLNGSAITVVPESGDRSPNPRPSSRESVSPRSTRSVDRLELKPTQLILLVTGSIGVVPDLITSLLSSSGPIRSSPGSGLLFIGSLRSVKAKLDRPRHRQDVDGSVRVRLVIRPIERRSSSGHRPGLAPLAPSILIRLV